MVVHLSATARTGQYFVKSTSQLCSCIFLQKKLEFRSIHLSHRYLENPESSAVSKAIKSITTSGSQTISSPINAKLPLSSRIKEGLLHYWHGSKLLAFETKVSTRLLWKMLLGHKLIRRERRQLRRTVSDLLRLVPFVVIMIIPFLEFALPVILKLFPNMLPSTFEDKATFEEKRKKQVKLKLEMAKFLQETVENMNIVNANSENLSKAKEFGDAFRKARLTGESLSDAEIVELSRQLSDTITLENLPRAQLVSICRYMSINAFGTDSFLRYQIRNKMKSIQDDDKLIEQEGLANLTYDELVNACNTRGIRSVSTVSRTKLEAELGQWLQLHLRYEIPSVLLILSRALAFHEPDMDAEEALQNVIMSLPEQIVDEANLESGEASLDSSQTYKQRLQILERQEDLIEEELAQEKKALENNASNELSPQIVEHLSEAVSVLSSPDPAKIEKSELNELKEDITNFKEEVSELSELSQKKLDLSETAKKLEDQIGRIVRDIEIELGRFEADIGNKLNIIKPDENGQLTVEQLESICRMLQSKDNEKMKLIEMIKKIDLDKDGKISIEDITKLSEEFQSKEGSGVLFNKPQSSDEN